MSLSDEQALFTADLAELILYANSFSGHAVVLGEAQRPPEMAAIYAARGLGIKRSLHTMKLAGDLALFIDGVYQTSTESYRTLGEWWEDRRSGNRWGGTFSRPDGNHFERVVLGTTQGGRART